MKFIAGPTDAVFATISRPGSAQTRGDASHDTSPLLLVSQFLLEPGASLATSPNRLAGVLALSKLMRGLSDPRAGTNIEARDYLGQLAERHWGHLVRSVLWTTKDPTRAEDAVAKVFLDIAANPATQRQLLDMNDADALGVLMQRSEWQAMRLYRAQIRRERIVQNVGFVEGPVDPKSRLSLRQDMTEVLAERARNYFDHWTTEQTNDQRIEVVRRTVFGGERNIDVAREIGVTKADVNNWKIAFLKDLRGYLELTLG